MCVGVGVEERGVHRVNVFLLSNVIRNVVCRCVILHVVHVVGCQHVFVEMGAWYVAGSPWVCVGMGVWEVLGYVWGWVCVHLCLVIYELYPFSQDFN